MRNGAKSFAIFAAIFIPALLISAPYTSSWGAGMCGLVVLWIMVKICNTFDRADHRQGSEQVKRKKAKR